MPATLGSTPTILDGMTEARYRKVPAISSSSLSEALDGDANVEVAHVPSQIPETFDPCLETADVCWLRSFVRPMRMERRRSSSRECHSGSSFGCPPRDRVIVSGLSCVAIGYRLRAVGPRLGVVRFEGYYPIIIRDGFLVVTRVGIDVGASFPLLPTRNAAMKLSIPHPLSKSTIVSPGLSAAR
jgi:hypothetical protein